VRTRLTLVGLLIVCAVAATEAQRAASGLPIQRVILYKSGVGYFEHVGSVTGSSDVVIPFTSSQLNDVLKSLTVLDLDGGSIANISYNSIAPVSQRLSALTLPLPNDASQLQFYQALRGARLEIHTGTSTTTGRLLAVESRPRTHSGITEISTELTIVSEDGDAKTIEMSPQTTVRVLDRDLRDDIGQYMSIVASGRNDAARQMAISTNGTGTRRLLVSYISEVPIWKSTYRLVLPDGDRKPVLQGWAIVDNTVGQDWTNVQLSLVAGAPQSFIQKISQPYYARRPVVPLPPTVLTQPQTHGGTLATEGAGLRGRVVDFSGAELPGVTITLLDQDGDEAATGTSSADGTYALNAGPGSYSLRAELEGFNTASRPVVLSTGITQVDLTMQIGRTAEEVTVNAAPRAAPAAKAFGVTGTAGGRVGGVVGGMPSPPTPFDYADRIQQQGSAATSEDLGDLFEYKLKDRVTIKRNQSALVPILNTPVDAERVSLWTRPEGTGRPLRAVWLTNSSALTLDGGTFAVVDAGAFAGEGLIDPLKPGEKRLVSYGSDLGVLVSVEKTDAPEHVTRIVARDGVLTTSAEERASWTYTIKDDDTTPRAVIIEHPTRSGWKLGADPVPAETTPGAARYRVAVAAKKDAKLTVSESRVDASTMQVSSIEEPFLVVLSQRGGNAAALRQALQPIFAKRVELSAAMAKLRAIDAEIASIGRDQERVRENMKALKGTPEEKALTERYTKELNDQEDRLAQLRSDRRTAEADQNARQTELNELARRLSFDV
jgi:hypothetical protein